MPERAPPDTSSPPLSSWIRPDGSCWAPAGMTPLHQSSSTCASVAPSITNTVISSPLPSQKLAGERWTSRTIGEFAARMRAAIRPRDPRLRPPGDPGQSRGRVALRIVGCVLPPMIWREPRYTVVALATSAGLTPNTVNASCRCRSREVTRCHRRVVTPGPRVRQGAQAVEPIGRAVPADLAPSPPRGCWSAIRRRFDRVPAAR